MRRFLTGLRLLSKTSKSHSAPLVSFFRTSRKFYDLIKKIQFRPLSLNANHVLTALYFFSGVPAVVDLAAMRDAMKRLGGDPAKINPLCPVDLVIDHSVQVDASSTSDAKEVNEKLEFSRNRERF